MEKWHIVITEENERSVKNLVGKKGSRHWFSKGAIYCFEGSNFIEAFSNQEHFSKSDWVSTEKREIVAEIKKEEGEDPYLWGNKIVSEPTDAAAENVFDKVTSSIADLLKYKNEKYGNSALEPMQVFEGKTKVGQRLDDKLARIKNSTELKKNDVADLIGYLTLVCVENDWTDFSEFKD